MRTFRIPLLIDLVSVSEPALIRDLANNPDLDRRAEGGPLLVRLIRSQISDALRTPEGPLPSAMPRDSQERADMRAALAQLLDDPALDARIDGAIADCATYVAGGNGAPGPLAQTLFGRIFVADFAATPHTWNAAKAVDRALGGPSIRGLYDRLTGAISRAQSTLSKAMNGDRNGVHTIGVAVHNFAKTLEALRALDRQTPVDKAIALSLAVPDRVPRQGTSIASTLAAPVRPGTLVLLNTGEARARSLDPRDGFLRDAWSGCPAHALVPRLLARVWSGAGGAP